MNELYKYKLEKIQNECDKHLLRINSSYKKMSVFMPLSEIKYENLTEDEIGYIDQFLFRFSKLQDTMGQKLFKNLLLSLDEDIENLPFIDILNKLEKLKIISSANVWRKLRDERNELAHNYEDDPEVTTHIINRLYEQKDTLETIYNNIKNILKGNYDKDGR